MKKFAIALLMILSIISVSCEIGLGASVDTEPPALTIQNPPVDSIIRDDFAISGIWSDDGYIDKIIVKLERTDGNGSPIEYEAPFVISDGKINEGTWKAIIKPKTENVLDGPYQATVTIKDTVGRTSIRNITFTIDNTPPIVVLQRPSSIISSTDSETDTYGQVFTLVGQAADDSNINTVEVQLYSDVACTNLVNTVTLNNVPATINLDVAKFVASTENDYSKIYGHTEKDGSETRYNKIVAYDSAQRYPVDGSNQDASDTKGNKQTIYYLYDDISSEILANHKITELYSMFNGTYIYTKGERAVTQADANSILTKLASKEISNGKFILNPENSPTFQLSGREGLKGDGTDFYTPSNGNTDNNISNNSTAIIEVAPGLDAIPLDGDSLRVYVQECDANGNVITTNGKDAKIYLPYFQDDESKGKTKNGSGYKFVLDVRNLYPSTELDSQGEPKNRLTLGHNYLFGVEGHDKNVPNGNPVVAASGKGYGFYFAASGAAPTLETKLEKSSDGTNWTEVTSQVSYMPKGTYVRISGSIKVEAGTPDFYLKHNDIQEDGITPQQVGDTTEYKFSKVYAPSDFGTSSKQHGFTLEASGSGGKTEKSYTVMYDMEGPAISDPEIKILGRNPLATKYVDEAGNTDGNDEKYLNGDNIRIKLSISDDFDVVDSSSNKTKIEIFEGTYSSTNPPATSVTPKKSQEINNPANFVWSDIATKNVIADGPITIRVTAYDRAGNKTEKYYSDYRVDQSTDNPVVLPNNAAQLSFALNTKASLTGAKNKFSSGSPILLQLIDDDELKSIIPSIASIPVDSDTLSSWETGAEVDLSGKTNYTYSYTNSKLSTTGFYALKFTVKDIYDNTTPIPSTGYFVIKITAAAPTIEDLTSVVRKPGSNADLETVYTRGKTGADENYFENKIIFNSEYTSFEIQRSTDGTTFTKIADHNSTNLSGSSGIYTYIDKAQPSAETKYYYQIVGIEGTQQVKSNVKNVTCKVDSEKPNSVILKTLPTVSNTEDDTFTISGTATDAGGSGIDKVKITIKGTHDSASVEKTVDATGQNSWSYDLTYASFGDVFKEEGEKSIYIQAFDVAGNESDVFKYGTTDYNNSTNLKTFEYDKKAPLFTVTGLSESGVNALDKEVNDTGYTISGTITEGYALAAAGAIQITVDDISQNTISAPVQSPSDTSNYTWSHVIPKGTADGKLKADEPVVVKVTVTDKVGKHTEKTFTLYYDTKAPDLEIKSPAEGEKIDNNAKVLKGTVSDGGFGIERIEYQLRQHGTETTIKDSSGKDISGAFYYDNGVGTRYGNYPLTIKGEQWYSVNSSGTEDAIPLGETEGDLDLYIKVTEKANGTSGGRVTEETRNFYFDKYNPNLTETEIGTAGLTTKAAEITLKGVAYDTNAIKSVKIKYNNGNQDIEKEATLVKKAATVSTVPYTDSQYAEWSYTFKTDNKDGVNTSASDYLPDGNYVFTIVAEDVSGKTVQLSRAVNLDTKAPSAPTVTVKTEKGATLDSSDWYTTSSLEIEVTADDATGGTGVSTVEYNTASTVTVNQQTNVTTITYDDNKWTALAPQKDGSVTKFKGTVSLRDDEDVVFGVRATDVAGNISVITPTTVNVDTSAPTLTAVSYSYDGDPVVAKADSVYVNGSKKLIVYGAYEDDDTGLNPLEITLGDTELSDTDVTVKYSATAMNGINPPAADTFKAFSEYEGSTNTTKTIKTWMLEFTPNADGDLKLNGKNRINKAAQECKAFTIVKDDESPQLANVSLTGSYKPEENVETYFINNEKTDFKLTGVSTDNIGLESLTITLKNSKDTSLTLIPALNAAEGSLNKWNYTLNNTDKALWNGTTKWPDNYAIESLRGKSKWQGGAQVTVTLTDKAKNTAIWNGTVYFDTVAPTGYHLIDDKGKDIFFRIGDAENDDINSTDNPTLWDNAKDKDVGKKYSTSTYGDAETVMLRGTVIDYPESEYGSATHTPNSGVKMIYYKVINEKNLTSSRTDAAARSAEVSNKATAFLAEYSDPTDRTGWGYFAPTSAGTRRVFYNVKDQTNPDDLNTHGGKLLPDSLDDGYYKYYKDVESTFKTTISGFEEGVNYLAFVLVDNVGNAALETVKVPDPSDASGYSSYNNYQVNVDKTVPVITTNSTGTEYVNGTEDLTLSGTVTDALAGVKSVEIKIGNSTETITVPKSGITSAGDANDANKKNWTIDIPANRFTEAGEITIYAIARDNAGTNGNPTTINAATVYVDKTFPKATVTKPTDADSTTSETEVNGTFTLTGTASDNSRMVNSVQVQYKKSTDSTWTNYGSPITENTSSWSIDINTLAKVTVLDEDGNETETLLFDDETLYNFRAVATDAAGNVGNSELVANEGRTNGYDANNSITIKVSQDSDRPILKLNNLSFHNGNAFMSSATNGEVWFNTSQVFASVEDDDGPIKSVKAISVIPTETIPNPPAPTAAQWTAASELYNNGIVTYRFTSNGYQKLYFRVVDNNNTEFISKVTSTTAGSYGPKITGSKHGEKANPDDEDDDTLIEEKIGYSGGVEDDIIYVRVDTNAPTLSDLKYYTSATVVTTPETSITDSDWKSSSELSRAVFGGSKKYLYIKYTATDKNGIDSVTPTITCIKPKTTQDEEDENKTLAVISNDCIDGTETSESRTYIAYFDIGKDKAASGKLTLNLEIKDRAAAKLGDDGELKTYDSTLDNSAPEIEFKNYTSGDQVYGSSAVTLRGKATDKMQVTKLEYALSEADDIVPIAASEWHTVTDDNTNETSSYTTASSWQIVFDGNTDSVDTSSYHAEKLREAMFDLWEVTDTNNDDTTRPVYIWIRATDELGNKETNLTGFCLNVIPNGDRPAIKITYPEKTSDNKLGGTIRITGTSEVIDTNAKVSAVYIQIDPNYTSGEISSTWYTSVQSLLTAKNSSDYTPVAISKYIDGSGEEKTLVSPNTIPTGYGIAVNGDANSWILPINRLGEFNDQVNEQNRKIGIRAVAVSTTGKVATSQIYICEVDANAPTFGDNELLRFVHYNASGVEDASRAFVTGGIKLKGKWYLEGSVEDGTGIASITFKKTKIEGNKKTAEPSVDIVSTDAQGNVTVSSMATAASWDADKNETSTEADIKTRGYRIKIPVSVETTDAVAEYEYEIEIADNSIQNLPNDTKFNVLYDNKKPSFTVLNGNGIALSTSATSQQIRQSNGSYTVNGNFSEASGESGFGRIVMYFTKTRGNNVYLLDPMVDDGTDGDANWKNYVIATVSEGTVIPASGFAMKEGMYWREIVINQLASNIITLTTDPSTLNIRVGGLCMVNNVIYRIKTVNTTTNTVTLDGTLVDIASTASPADRTVYFALAQVIDNMGQETNASDNKGTRVYDYSATDPITTQDGDYMLEGVVLNSGAYDWNVSLDSSNMMDGITDMTFIAFDAAGNSTDPAVYNMKISNNVPRIAGVIFAADKNMNGKFDDDEIESNYHEKFHNQHEDHQGVNDPWYYGQTEQGTPIIDYAPYGRGDSASKRLTVKGPMYVKPEIVGGNTALAWSYSYKHTNGQSTSTEKIAYAGLGHSNDGSIRSEDLTINITLKDILNNNIADGNQDMVFSIWDRTDGAEFGAPGSEHADITIPVAISIRDEEAPTAVVDPFSWTSKTVNSLYQNKPENGHIELEGDLPDAFTEDGTLAMDRDAKVSGLITFTGQAEDNVMVKKLAVTIDGYNLSNNVAQEFDIAERDASATTTNGWKSTHLYYEAENAEGNMVPVEGASASLLGTSASDWVVEIISDTYDANGKNIVQFKFHFNTAKVSGVAKTDVGFAFKAYDQGSPSVTNNAVSYPETGNPSVLTMYGEGNNAKALSTGRTADAPLVISDDPTANKTPYYKVDVVPYITGISTGLDGAYKSKTSVFNRSALGYYPVRRGETITVKGFNLKNGNTAPTVKINSNSAALTNAQKAASTVSTFAVNIPDAASSGDLEVTVSSIETLNNKTSKTAEYNQEPNGINNNILTDIRKLSVWSFENALTTNNTTIRYPSMRVGKDANQTVGFVYDSGAQAVRMNQGGSDYLIDWSFTQWYATSVAVDNAGRMYGSGMNGDSGGKGNQSWNGSDDGGYANYGFYAWNTKTYPGYIRDMNRTTFSAPGTGTYLNHQAYNSGRKKVALENSSADSNGNNFSATRVMNPKIVATSGTANTSTGYVYTAYYDSIFDRVVFRYGTVSGTMDSNTSNLTFTGGLGNHGNTNNGSAVNMQIIAGAGATGTNSIDGVTAVANTSRAGEYVAVGVIPKAQIATDAEIDGAVVAWYDASNQRLLFSYNKDPTSTANAANWGTNTQVIDDDFAGWYVDMAVDPDGNVHIAYYGASNGDLKYAYLPIAKDANGKLYTQGAQVCTVDSYLSVGTNISIDIPTAKETVYKADGTTTTRYVPRISYFMSAFTKTKYSVRTASLYKLGANDVITDGAEDDKFTGNWEVMSVPTNQIPLDYTIGVGLKNNDAGTSSTLLGYGTTTNLQTAALQ